jgi:hypothetical protein
MLQKDVRQVDIAKEAKCSRPTVFQVVHGLARSRRIEKIIAQRVQLPHQTIFPIAPEPLRGRDDQAA